MQPQLSYTASKTVSQFAQSNALVRLIIGPYGSGKSVGSIMEAIRRAFEQMPDERGIRRTKFVFVRNTYRELDDTTLQTFLEWIPDGVFGTYHKSDRRYEFEMRHPDGTLVRSTILFRALDKPADEKKVLSLEITGAWFNEFREIPVRLMVAMVGRRRFPKTLYGPDGKMIYGPTWTGIYGDSNPPDKESQYYKIMEGIYDERHSDVMVGEGDNDRPFFEGFKQPSGMSPEAENIEHLPKNYYQDMIRTARLEGRDDNWVNVHVHGQYGYTPEGKPVYEGSFAPDFHVTADIEPDIKRVPGIGYDPGLLHSAGVIGQMQSDGTWEIYDEILLENKVTDDMIREVERRLRILGFSEHPRPVWWGDPACRERSKTDKKSPRDIIRSCGYDFRISEKGIETRINSVRSVLNKASRGRPFFKIHPRCKILIHGFMGGYHLRRKQTSREEYALVPAKTRESHPHDALQYLIAPFSTVNEKGGNRTWPENKLSVAEQLGASRSGPPPAADFNPHTLFA